MVNSPYPLCMLPVDWRYSCVIRCVSEFLIQIAGLCVPLHLHLLFTIQKKRDNQVDAFFSLERKILMTHNYDLKQANTQLDLYQGVESRVAYGAFLGSKLSVQLPHKLNCQIVFLRDDCQWLLLTCCLAMESFAGIITFQSALPSLTRVHLRMGTCMHSYFWILFATKKPFFFTLDFPNHGHLCLCECAGMTRNDFWIHFEGIASECLANFQSGLTFPARRGKSLEAPPQCLWIADQGVKTL